MQVIRPFLSFICMQRSQLHWRSCIHTHNKLKHMHKVTAMLSSRPTRGSHHLATLDTLVTIVPTLHSSVAMVISALRRLLRVNGNPNT